MQAVEALASGAGAFTPVPAWLVRSLPTRAEACLLLEQAKREAKQAGTDFSCAEQRSHLMAWEAACSLLGAAAVTPELADVPLPAPEVLWIDGQPQIVEWARAVLRLTLLTAERAPELRQRQLCREPYLTEQTTLCLSGPRRTARFCHVPVCSWNAEFEEGCATCPYCEKPGLPLRKES